MSRFPSGSKSAREHIKVVHTYLGGLITWIEAFRLSMKTFLEVAVEKYMLADEELDSLLEAFIVALPTPLKNRLL